MKLVLLGTAGYHPSDQRQTACLMLPDLGILLDAGTGMYRAADYLSTDRLDIFLTHSHLDHIVGLTYLFDVIAGRRIAPIMIHGAAEKLAAIREHVFSELIFPVLPPCQFVPLTGPVDLAGGGRLQSFPLVHPGGTLGFRLNWPGHSLAYVTDTTARIDAGYVEQIRGVDLLVHECNFPDSQAEFAEQTGHSWTTAVAEVARAAAVGKLVLVHINPLAREADPVGLAAAQAIFPRTELGHDRMVVEF
ncbi:MAG TPA: MBL fold metallo-hydrolase [Pirellulales bacterium]|nr:MBL fold metallo-hydrolase [Pirellulales bacterium]